MERWSSARCVAWRLRWTFVLPHHALPRVPPSCVFMILYFFEFRGSGAYKHRRSYDLLFQCNTLDRDPRPIIWKQMTEGKGPGSPIPVNRAPLEAAEMVTATAKGIFAVSPPGTGLCGGVLVAWRNVYHYCLYQTAGLCSRMFLAQQWRV